MGKKVEINVGAAFSRDVFNRGIQRFANPVEQESREDIYRRDAEVAEKETYHLSGDCDNE